MIDVEPALEPTGEALGGLTAAAPVKLEAELDT